MGYLSCFVATDCILKLADCGYKIPHAWVASSDQSRNIKIKYRKFKVKVHI